MFTKSGIQEKPDRQFYSQRLKETIVYEANSNKILWLIPVPDIVCIYMSLYTHCIHTRDQ